MKKLILVFGSLVIISCGVTNTAMTLKERDLPAYCIDFVRDDGFIKHQSKVLSDSRYKSAQYRACRDLVMKKIKRG